jgi:hypothetical protein
MTEPGEPIRRIMSVGVVAVDEELTLRSVAAVIGHMFTRAYSTRTSSTSRADTMPTIVPFSTTGR